MDPNRTLKLLRAGKIRKKEEFLEKAGNFLASGDVSSAIEEYMKALKNDPQNPELAYKIAELEKKIPKPYIYSRDLYAREFYRLAASLYARKGFFRKAAAAYRRVLEISPNDKTATLELAKCYNQLGMTKLAMEYNKRYENATKNEI